MFYRWQQSRSGLNAFSSAVLAEMKALSVMPDNIDSGLINWHNGSIRRLKALSASIKITSKRQWGQIKPAWDDYLICADRPKESCDYTAIKGVEGLEEKLAALYSASCKA